MSWPAVVPVAVVMGPDGGSENGEQQLDQHQAQEAETAEQGEGCGHRQPPSAHFLKQTLRGWGIVAKSGASRLGPLSPSQPG